MKLLCQLVVLAVAGGCFSGTADSAESEYPALNDTFNELRRGIERHCPNCRGRSESEFKRLVSELEALVNSGFTSFEARKLLADSYHQSAIEYTPLESPERTELLNKHQEIYSGLLEEYPKNIEVLLDFARTSEDVAVVESARNRITTLYSEANYSSGSLLRAQADEESKALLGLELLREAFRTSSLLEKAFYYGMKLVSELSTEGLESEAARVEEEMLAYRREFRGQ